MAELETLLALVEGWVDTVVAEAVGDRLPGAPRAARDAAPSPGHRRTGRADLRHPDRPGAAAAAAACRRRPVAGDRRRPRHRRPGRAVGAPRSAADRQGPGRSRRFRRPGQAVRRAAGRAGRHRDRSCWATPGDPSRTATDPAPTDQDARPTTARHRRRPGPAPTSRRPAPPGRLTQTALDGLHRLIPESTACCSMTASSSSSKARLPIGGEVVLQLLAPTTRRPAPRSPARPAAPRPAPSAPATGRARRRSR